MFSKPITYLILFGGVFALSSSAIFVKIADAPSAVIAFYRLFIAALILLPFFVFGKESRNELKNLQKGQWIRIISAGALLAFHYVLWFESLNFTSIASSTVLVSLQPLFSLALDRFANKIKIKKTALVGCAVALVGSFVIGFGDFKISGKCLLGDILALVAAAVISGYFFVGEKVRKDISAVTYSTMSYFFSAIILIIYILLRSEPLTGHDGKTWLAFIGLAVVSTIGGQFVFNLLLKKVPASAVTMSILGEPVGTCILAYLMFKENISLQQLVGICIIMIGMTVYFFLPNKKQLNFGG